MIIGISIIYLYFGRFITIAIGMFFLALQWDDANICLSFVTYIEQLLIIAMLVWYILKERDIIKWGIVALLGILILYITVISEHFNSIPIVEQMKKTEGITEVLKEHNQWEWIQRMGNIQQKATEIVCNDLIFQ